jgi:SAM-dependent methyltransferase
VSAKTTLLEHPLVYRLWQAPFAGAKLLPVCVNNDLSQVRRVLDVGCGPGTNARYFAHSDYLGVDVNPRYIEYARRRYGRAFRVADVNQLEIAPGETFDFILVNSLLHHLDDVETRRLLNKLSTLLSETGQVHILELVMPDHAGISRALARWDRGRYARSSARWQELFREVFEPIMLHPYSLDLFGVELWSMVYFKGRRRSSDQPHLAGRAGA